MFDKKNPLQYFASFKRSLFQSDWGRAPIYIKRKSVTPGKKKNLPDTCENMMQGLEGAQYVIKGHRTLMQEKGDKAFRLIYFRPFWK